MNGQGGKQFRDHSSWRGLSPYTSLASSTQSLPALAGDLANPQLWLAAGRTELRWGSQGKRRKGR